MIDNKWQNTIAELSKNVIQKILVLKTIKELNGSTDRIEKIHIEDIIKLCTNNIGNKYLTPNKNLKILVKDKKIFFIKMNWQNWLVKLKSARKPRKL